MSAIDSDSDPMLIWIERARAAERERDEARDQLRLANIDAFNSETELVALRTALDEECRAVLADVVAWYDELDGALGPGEAALFDRARAVLAGSSPQPEPRCPRCNMKLTMNGPSGELFHEATATVACPRDVGEQP